MFNKGKYLEKKYGLFKDCFSNIPEDPVKAKQYLSGKTTSYYNKYLKEEKKYIKRIYKEIWVILKNM